MDHRSSTTGRADDPNRDSWTQKQIKEGTPGGYCHRPARDLFTPLSSSKTKNTKYINYTHNPFSAVNIIIYCDTDVVLSLTPSAVMTTTIV